MEDLDPVVALENPDLVRTVAPWCQTLDNLELAVILLAQPWIVRNGVRRAELERQLERLGGQMPLGPVYFQRVNRAVARLEERQCLSGSGSGRARRFLTTPQGLAALIVNLRVLSADPTLDPAEFEFKRNLVALWSVVLERIGELPEEIPMAPEDERFFAEVEQLTIFGRRVIHDDLVGQALDVLRLIEDQRRRVGELRAAARERLAQEGGKVGFLEDVDLSDLSSTRLPAGASTMVDSPEVAAMVRHLATVTLPCLTGEASLLRYDAYLGYLDALDALYSERLKVVSFKTLRRLSGGRRS